MSPGKDSPRILYLSSFWPHRTSIGAEVRSLEVLRALQQIGNVEVVVLHDANDGVATKCLPESKSANSVKVETCPNKGWIEKARWTLDPRTDFPFGCRVDGEGTQRILRKLDEFDVIWFFKLRGPNMFPYAPWPRSVVDVDDVPSTYEQAVLRNKCGLRERLRAHLNLFSWRRRERLLGERFTVLTVCSEGDKQYLNSIGVKSPTHVIPNGFEKPRTEPVRKPGTPPRIGFIGLFDYLPNREGIHWFANQCWPRIKREVPEARLRLVGQGSDGPAKPDAPGVEGLGWLANPADEIATWSATVVPIRLGAGTRVKIAQAFSQKCPIVSTTLGAYGYEAVDGREMYLADSAEAFAERCVRAIREPEKAAQMAEKAWRQFLENWTWDAIRPRIWAAAEDCLRLSGRTSSRG